MIKMPKKDEYIRFKIYKREIKATFMIYDFESILVPGDNEKQNPEVSFTNKYQNHVDCSYSYKLVCADDKFSKPFKRYLDEDVAYNFINTLIKKSKFCIDIMKIHFNK